ncbi:MAG: hypothetical protein HYR70_13260 [Chloroflexi bacterium]|nr:hypothetical protein [Chloroflexota bacterium]MBI3339599.1 hypothetical protein [Chloroflexota bacterium]
MQRRNIGIFLGSVSFALWLIVCVTLFIVYAARSSYIYQFIFDGFGPAFLSISRVEPFSYFWGLAVSLLGSLLFSLSYISLGLFLFDLLGGWPAGASRTLPGYLALIGTAFLLGQMAISSIFILLGGLYQLTAGEVIVTILLMTLVGAKSCIRLFGNIKRNQLANPASETLDNFDKTLLSFSAIAVALGLLYSSARLSYDSVAVYFSNARLTALTNHIQFFPNDAFITSSFHAGIQYAAIIQVFGDQAARMYSWVGGIVLLIFMIALGETLGLSRRSRIALLAMLVTSTAFFDLLGDGKIDLWTSAPALAAAYWMVVDSQLPGRRGPPFLVGLLVGFAIISRPFNAPLLFVFMTLFYLLEAFVHKNEAEWHLGLLIKKMLEIGAGVLILASFHLIADWIILGDLLATFANASKMTSTSIWQWSFDPRDIWVFRLLYPFVVTFINSPQSLGNISPLFLALLPLFFLREVRLQVKISRELTCLLFAALATLILWIGLYFAVEEIRYVLFLWIVIFMPVASLTDISLHATGGIFPKLIKSILSILLIFVSVRAIFISLATYSPIDKNGNPQCYDIPFCDFLRPVNEIAPLGSRVLALNAYRYYLRSDLFVCSSRAGEYEVLRDVSKKSAEAFWLEVYRQGYQYVTYEKNYAVRHLFIDFVPAPSNVPAWMELEPIFGVPGDVVVAYRVVVTNPPVQSRKMCQKDSAGIWEVTTVGQ